MIPAPRERAWARLVDLASWPGWNRLVPQGAGEVREGETLSFRIRGVRRAHQPVVVRVAEPQEIVLAATFVHRWILRMEHTFAFVPVGEGCRLDQHWDITGLLAPLLWWRLVPAMAQFSELGEDLSAAAAVPEPGRAGARGSGA